MAAAKRKGKAMAKRSTTPERRTSSLSRILQARWRLLLALLFGAAVASLLPGDLRLVSRLLIGWDAGIALYIVLVLLMIAGADTGHMRRESARQEEGRIVIQVLTVTAGPAGLGAIVLWLRTAPGSDYSPLSLALLFMTTLLYWAFIHIMFARCITPTNITRSIAAKVAACAFPERPSPAIGISSIWLSPSARRPKSPTSR